MATARRGVSNGDGSEIRLYGDAQVRREPTPRAEGGSTPQLEIRGEFLHAFTEEERVSSDQPVELWRGADRFTADSMDFDNAQQVLQLSGRVRGKYSRPS